MGNFNVLIEVGRLSFPWCRHCTCQATSHLLVQVVPHSEAPPPESIECGDKQNKCSLETQDPWNLSNQYCSGLQHYLDQVIEPFL